MCLLSFIHTWIGFLTLKTYLFGMFVLYTNQIGFVNRFFENFYYNFYSTRKAALLSEKSTSPHTFMSELLSFCHKKWANNRRMVTFLWANNSGLTTKRWGNVIIPAVFPTYTDMGELNVKDIRGVCFCYIVRCLYSDSRLPIVLFVG